MAETLMSDEELLARLNAHPALRGGVESLVLAVEDEAGQLNTADAAEMQVIALLRRTGQDALHAWANLKVKKASEELTHKAGYWREGKKNSAGTPPLATSA